MVQALTRRGLVAAAPAAVVAASLPAYAGAHADAELLALRPVWIKTRAEFEAALNSLSAAQDRFFARRPELPEYSSFGGTYDEFLAEHSRALSLWKALEIETGVAAVEELEGRTLYADSALVDRIAAIPALTKEGIRFKREVADDWRGCERNDIQQSILKDLLAMTGGLHV